MLGIAVIASILTTPGQTAGVSLFAPSFEDALGLTRTQQTGAYAMGTFAASLVMTFVGAQMDRFGIRKVMAVVLIAFGLVCAYTGLVTGFWTLFIAFLFLRMFGQGSLSLLAQNTPAMWFDKRLGFTQAILGVGFSLAAAGMPPFAFWLIERFGWRTAYPILGIIVVSILMPLIIFFFVDRPEDIGQTLDGGWIGAGRTSPNKGNGDQFTLQQAVQTRAYWIITGMMFSVSMIGTAITFNSLFLFAELGLTESQAVAILATMSLTTAIAQIPAGALADYIPLHWLAFVNMACQTASMILLLSVSSIGTATIFAITIGLAVSLHNGVIGPLWARYFGREHLGKIRGSVFTATVAGSSLGPFVMGFLFDLTGSYSPSIIIFAAIYGCICMLTPFAKQPDLEDFKHVKKT